MRIKNVQISFEDIYNHVSDSMEKQDCKLVSLLDEHINLDELIPYEFKRAFSNCSSLETINCKAESQPSGWSNNWKYNCSAEVIWGYKG